MENIDTECADMPALRCSRCFGIASKGGGEWEKNNPSEQVGFCNCNQNNTIESNNDNSWHKIMEDLRILGEKTNNTISNIRNNFK